MPTMPSLLAVTYRLTDSLKADLKNPRCHSKGQIKKISRSIKSFGFVTPILVDGDGTIIAGHARVAAARQLGMTQVPTITIGHLTGEQRTLLMIADNRLAECASWDDTLLREIFHDLEIANLNLDLELDLELSGFEMGEIDLLLAGPQTPGRGEVAADPADTIPPAAPGPAVSQPGDLWLLGRHRVLCGNATDPAAYGSLMDGREATMVFTDPPYNVPIAGHVSGLGAIQHREFPMASGEMSAAAFTGFLAEIFGLMVEHSRDGSLHYVCMDWRHQGEVLAAAKVFSELKNLCVWVKTNAGMGSMYRSQHELIFVFKHGRGRHRNNVELGRHGRHRSNVWIFPGANTFGRAGEEGNLLALHPTVKPVALVADAILDCTARGALVLHPFLGSGTTILAAERTGRRCYGLDLDPLYVDLVVRRWQRHTGGSARHAISGQRFDDRAGEGRSNG